MTQAAKQRLILAVGIIVLAIGLVVIISVVKQRGEAARHAEIVKVADEAARVSDEAKRSQTEKTSPQDQNVSTKETHTPATDDIPAQSELPQTGSGSIVVQVGQIALVTFLGVAYIRSRQTA